MAWQNPSSSARKVVVVDINQNNCSTVALVARAFRHSRDAGESTARPRRSRHWSAYSVRRSACNNASRRRRWYMLRSPDFDARDRALRASILGGAANGARS